MDNYPLSNAIYHMISTVQYRITDVTVLHYNLSVTWYSMIANFYYNTSSQKIAANWIWEYHTVQYSIMTVLAITVLFILPKQLLWWYHNNGYQTFHGNCLSVVVRAAAEDITCRDENMTATWPRPSFIFFSYLLASRDDLRESGVHGVMTRAFADEVSRKSLKEA